MGAAPARAPCCMSSAGVVYHGSVSRSGLKEGDEEGNGATYDGGGSGASLAVDEGDRWTGLRLPGCAYDCIRGNGRSGGGGWTGAVEAVPRRDDGFSGALRVSRLSKSENASAGTDARNGLADEAGIAASEAGDESPTGETSWLVG